VLAPYKSCLVTNTSEDHNTSTIRDQVMNVRWQLVYVRTGVGLDQGNWPVGVRDELFYCESQHHFIVLASLLAVYHI
jgi:hypothetical protein